MNDKKAMTCARVQVNGLAPIADIAFRSDSLPAATPPHRWGVTVCLEVAVYRGLDKIKTAARISQLMVQAAKLGARRVFGGAL